MEKPSIFISYSSKDRETAEIIHQQLKSSGFDVWRDKTRLETDWSREIAQALADSEVLCLLWSKHAAQSKWVMHEWLTARALEKTIILCRLSEAPKSPEPLHNLQEVSLDSLEKGGQELIGRLKDRSDFTSKYDYTVLPENSYIPFNPNPNFTGRGQDLLELYLKLIGNLNKIGINQVGTVGMGGIGKTQLVVEFAYRFSFAFGGVYWIQAADKGEWLDQFVELARDQLQLSIASDPERQEADKQYIYVLRKYCKENPNTLIIMDNVAEPKLLNSDSFLFGLTPLTLGCDLLFTTRKHFSLPGVSSQPVNILSKAGAYTLVTSYRKPHTPDEQKHAALIGNAVGYLPLAIILAGAFLNRYESETPFSDYHDELLKNKLNTIDIGEISEKHLATRHEAAVATTLKSQWDTLDDENAEKLFLLAGQLPEAQIIPKARLGLLAGIGQGKSKLDQPLVKAFNLLQDYNLVEKLEGDASAIRLHPLIHDFAMRLIQQEDIAAFKYTAANRVKAAVFEYSHLQSVLEQRGIQQLLGDMEVAIEWWGKDKHGLKEFELLRHALQLSFSQLLKDSDQLATQLLGRLTSSKKSGISSIPRWLMSSKTSGIERLLEEAAKGKKGAWLRPITPSLVSPGGPLLRTLEGHMRGVSAVAIAPDGKTAVSAAWDKPLKVWDLHAGEVRKTLAGHMRGVTAVAITPDSKTAVSASRDDTLKVWNLLTGEVHQTLVGHSLGVTAVATAPDGKTAVSASQDRTLKIWDLHSGEVIQTLKGHGAGVTAVAIAPDGKIAVSASADKTHKVWDLQLCEVLQTLVGDTEVATAVAITPNGKTAVSAYWNKRLKVRHLYSGEVLRTLEGHRGPVTAVATAPDGKTAVSASQDRTLKIWDLHSGEVIQTLKGHVDWVTDVAIAPDGKTAVSASQDATLKVWDLHSSGVRQNLSGHTRGIPAVAIALGRRAAVSATEGGTLQVWDLLTGEVHQTLEGHVYRVTDVAIAPDGNIAVLASQDATLKVWDLSNGEVRQTLVGHRFGVTAVAIAPDSKTAVSASQDATLKVWNLHTGEVVQTLQGHGAEVTAVAIAPGGKTAVSASEDATLKGWDLHSGKVLYSVPCGHPVYAVAISYSRVPPFCDASQFVDSTLELETAFASMARHHERVKAVWVYTEGKELGIWDSHADEPYQTLPGHEEVVTAVAIARDGKTMASASKDRTLKLWDLQAGAQTASFHGDSELSACDIAPDGKIVVVGEVSGRMHFLRLEGMG